jgi:alkylation response protein AidB-like acyl-CoA dehydrogenase
VENARAQLGAQLGARSVLAERARDLVPLVDKHAELADEEGVLSDDVVAALHRDGLFGLWVPEVLGGSELDAVRSLEVIETLSYGDPSVGWVVMAASLSIGTGGAYLGDDAVEELWADGRMPVIAGQGTRPGTATAQDGGFVLSGAWSFASGIKHATHIHTLGIVEETGEPRIFVVPVERATLIENWDVLGLRGTGSIDYTIDQVFVPESYSHFATTDTPRRGGSLYHIGIIGFAEICHSGWALGVGRRMLDELALLVQSKQGRPGTQADNVALHEGIAKAEATYRSARAFVQEVWTDVTDTLDRGERPSVRQHTLIRLALTNVTASLHDVGNFVYLAGGTTALRRGTIQRLLRDVHAGTQHVTSSPQVVQTCGRELAGLADGQVWRFLDLVEPG